jgi:hypothetical protein
LTGATGVAQKISRLQPENPNRDRPIPLTDSTQSEASDRRRDRDMKLEGTDETLAGRPDAGEGTRPVACVLLGAPKFPPSSSLIKAIQRRLPGFVDACPDHADGGPALIGRIEDKHCVVAFCDESGALDPDASCIASAWWWQDAWESLERSQAYVLVSIVEADDPWRCWSILSQLTAAVIETAPAIGVLWEPADAVWPADEFRAEVDEAGETLPVRMLVSVKLGRDECPGRDGSPTLYGLTWGLSAFNLMEIELRCFEGDALEMVGILLDMASYLIKRGAVIGDGHTIGQDGDEKKFMVRHEPSSIVPGWTVYRLYLASTRVS